MISGCLSVRVSDEDRLASLSHFLCVYVQISVTCQIRVTTFKVKFYLDMKLQSFYYSYSKVIIFVGADPGFCKKKKSV